MSRCTRILIEDHNGEQWVKTYANAKIEDPTELAVNELNLGMNGISPVRMPWGWAPAFVGENGAIHSKFVNGAETEMTQAEKDIVNLEISNAEAAVKDTEANIALWSRRDKAFAEVLRDEINTLRALHSLPARTLGQLVTALRNKLDE